MKRIIWPGLYFFASALSVWGQQPRLVLPIGHTEGIETASFSADGKKILTSASDGSAKIWETQSGKLLFDLKEHNDSISFASFSPDGKKIVTASFYGTPKIWDTYTAKLILSLTGGHNKNIVSVAFSPDAKKIITASFDNITRIWNAQTGNIILELKGHTHFVNSATFSPDGKKIITTSYDGTSKIWDAQTGIIIFELTKQTLPVKQASFSPDGKKIITVSNTDVKIWDAQTGKLLTDFSNTICSFSGGFPHWGDIHSAAFSPDGRKIVTAGSDRTIKIWDANSCKQYLTLRGHAGVVSTATYSPDGKKIVTGSFDKTAKIWDAQTGEPLISLKGYTQEVKSAAFSSDGEKILTHYERRPQIWDAQTGEFLLNWNGYDDKVISTVFSPDGKKIATTSFDKTVKVWDIHTRKLLLNLKGHTDNVLSVTYSPDGRKLVTTSVDGTVKIWDVITGKMLLSWSTGLSIESAFFTPPDGKAILTFHGVWGVYRWDAETGKETGRLNFSIIQGSSDAKKAITVTKGEGIESHTAKIVGEKGVLHILEGHSDKITSAAFSPDDRKIVTGSRDNTAKIWDVQTGKCLFDLKGHSHFINTVSFSPSGKQILTSSRDNTCKRWDAETGELLCTFFILDSVDYLLHLPAGYYRSTTSAAKLLHYVTKDLKVITFEQLDVKYNRPDKVLEAIGNTDTALINSYRKAWEKRIKKLGIDTTAFRDGYSVPEADFVNRDAIAYEQNNGTLKLQIKGTDSTYKLDRFNIWINEAPLFGQRGISIKKRSSYDLDTTITVKLSQGENRIETSITNVNGTESYRMPVYVNYTPAIKQKESVRFIGIGIDKFTDGKYNLQYSAKDIRDLSKKLKEKYKDEIVIDTLFNEQVTVSNVKALKRKLQQTTVNDKVIIAYSGHGMLSKEYDYYLSTYSVNFEKPEENGLPYDELENLLDSIPARKKLMLIDACHSGEVDKEDLVTLNASSDSLIKGFKPVAYKKEGRLGLKNSFELMQSLFVNVGKSTGATIISAAAGTQFALERNDLKNGVFTYSILEAMTKYPTMKISELKKIVGERVEQLTKGLQKPTSRNETVAVEWNIW